METRSSIKLLMSGGVDDNEQSISDEYNSCFTYMTVINAIVHEVTKLFYLKIFGWIQRPSAYL